MFGGETAHMTSTSHLALQKADGTCNTNFKKTQALEHVTKVLEDFVDGDLGILVSGAPYPKRQPPKTVPFRVASDPCSLALGCDALS